MIRYADWRNLSWRSPKSLVFFVSVLLSVIAATLILREVNPLFIFAFLAIAILLGLSGSFLMVPLTLYVLAIFFDDTGLVEIGSAAKWLGVVAGLLLIVRGLLTRAWRPPARSAWFFAAFCFWGLLTIFWSIRPDESQSALITLVELVSLSVALSVTPLSGRELRLIREMVVVGGTLVAAFGLWQWFEAGALTVVRLGLDQVSGPSTNPNLLAHNLYLPISFSLAGILVAKRFGPRAWSGFAFTTMMVAVTLTQSRGGIVGVICILSFVLWSHRKVQLRTLVALVIFGILVWQLLPVLLARFTGAEFWSGSGRLDIWKVGIQALKSYWIAGSGLGTFPFAYFEVVSLKGGGMRRGVPLELDAHNLYLQLGVELGVVGVVLFAIAFLSLFRGLLRIERREEDPLPPSSLRAALIGFLVSAFFSGFIRVKLFWLTVGLSMLVVVWSRSSSMVEGRAMRRREEATQARLPLHGQEG